MLPKEESCARLFLSYPCSQDIDRGVYLKLNWEYRLKDQNAARQQLIRKE